MIRGMLRVQFLRALSRRRQICYVNCGRRQYGNSTIEDLYDAYKVEKARSINRSYTNSINAKRIFANKEVNLEEIEVYGFDYDYTIANYTEDMHYLLYDMAVDVLVNDYKYPVDIKAFPYHSDFGVRGLHYDCQKGLLMKVDSQHHIEFGSVYRGYTQLDDAEVLALYGGSHLPIDYLHSAYETGKYMCQLVDLYSLPEMVLLSQIAEYFKRRKMTYDPAYIFSDVKGAVSKVHLSGKMHTIVRENIGKYLLTDTKLAELFYYLVNAGKKLFIITNTSFRNLNTGMRHIINKDWKNLFDIIIVDAKKPRFYTEGSHRFRRLSTSDLTPTWDRVKKFRKGEVYVSGSAKQFLALAGVRGPEVLYFGDQVYSDLADPAMKLGWKTGAIIPELEREVNVINSEDYQRTLKWFILLQELIDQGQSVRSPESMEILDEWKREHQELRNVLKSYFNRRFGSMFRTSTKATFFSRKISRFADLYTSSVTNLLNYQLHHMFYQKIAALPHELD